MKHIGIIFFVIYASLVLSSCSNNSDSIQEHQDIAKPVSIPISHIYCDDLDTALTYPDEIVNLSIRGMEIDSLPINFTKMSKLKTLFIGACEKLNFSLLFKELSKSNTIEDLEISECHIEKLPPEIGEIKSLKTLFFTNDSNLKKLPPQIENLSNLENLYLYGNRLNSFPILNKTDFKNIKRINLALNNFKEIPESLFELTSLDSLIFQDNSIEKISDKISKLTNLKYLNIGGNPISNRAAKKFKEKKNYGEEIEKLITLMKGCKIDLYRAPEIVSEGKTIIIKVPQ